MHWRVSPLKRPSTHDAGCRNCFQVLFGSSPNFPTVDRVWQVIERYRVRHLASSRLTCVSSWTCNHSCLNATELAPPSSIVEVCQRQSSQTHSKCSRVLSVSPQVRVFYTAPTLIRALMQHGDEPVKRHDRSSLRVLATVGEPIGAPPAV